MLPAGVLLARRAAVGPRALAAGARWFRRDGAGERVVAAPPARRTCHRGRDHVRPPAAGYCSAAAAGRKRTVVPFLLADIGEGISEVTVKEWHVDVGDRVAEFDDVCEVESDKATVTITSRYAGTVTARHYETGGVARVGSALVDIEVEAEAGAGEASEDAGAAPEDAGAAPEDAGGATGDATRREPSAGDAGDHVAGRVLTTPAVRRIAAQRGIDLAAVRGTGKNGRVLKEDLLGEPATAVPAPPLDCVPLTGYEKKMRAAMEESNEIPTLVITDEVDLTRLTALRAQIAAHAKFTMLPFLIKATSLTLADHPRVNSTAGPDHASYRPNASHNIGVAIATPLGLAVPNVKDVQTLTVAEVAGRLAELRARAETGRLAVADVTGGTFTLSNIGSIAGTAFRPMINPPEVAIGALGRVRYRPRYDDRHRLVRTPVMGVSWAADHRILDGAAVARFFRDWKTYVENPALILAGVRLSSGE